MSIAAAHMVSKGGCWKLSNDQRGASQILLGVTAKCTGVRGGLKTPWGRLTGETSWIQAQAGRLSWTQGSLHGDLAVSSLLAC